MAPISCASWPNLLVISFGSTGSSYCFRIFRVAWSNGALMPTPPPKTNSEVFRTTEMFYTA